MSEGSTRGRIVGLTAALANKVPPIRGLGLILEHATKAFSNWDVEVAARIDGSLMWANSTIVSGRRRLFTSAYHDRGERAFVKRVVKRGDYVIDIEGFEYRVLKRYFADTPVALRPQWILIEEWETPPEGSARAVQRGRLPRRAPLEHQLCVAAGRGQSPPELIRAPRSPRKAPRLRSSAG